MRLATLVLHRAPSPVSSKTPVVIDVKNLRSLSEISFCTGVAPGPASVFALASVFERAILCGVGASDTDSSTTQKYDFNIAWMVI